MRESQTCLESLVGAMDANGIVAAVAAAWTIASCLGILTLAAVLDSSLAMALSHMPSLDLVDLRVTISKGTYDEHSWFRWVGSVVAAGREGQGQEGEALSYCACSPSPCPLLKRKKERVDAMRGWITYSSQRSHVYRWACVLLLLALPRLVAAAAGDVAGTVVAAVASAWLLGLGFGLGTKGVSPVSVGRSFLTLCLVFYCNISYDTAEQRGSACIPGEVKVLRSDGAEGRGADQRRTGWNGRLVGRVMEGRQE